MGYGRNKYNAKRTVVDNIPFHSAAESRRYSELKLLFRAGQIRNLQLQPKFPLHAYGGELLGVYKADFAYFQGGLRIVEDVKGGPIPPLSKWKINHAEKEYKIKVNIVREK